MLQYVNTFNCLYESTEETVVLRLSQSEPHVDDSGQISTENHDIAAIAMSRSGAQALINTLLSVLSEQPE